MNQTEEKTKHLDFNNIVKIYAGWAFLISVITVSVLCIVDVASCLWCEDSNPATALSNVAVMFVLRRRTQHKVLQLWRSNDDSTSGCPLQTDQGTCK